MSSKRFVIVAVKTEEYADAEHYTYYASDAAFDDLEDAERYVREHAGIVEDYILGER